MGKGGGDSRTADAGTSGTFDLGGDRETAVEP